MLGEMCRTVRCTGRDYLLTFRHMLQYVTLHIDNHLKFTWKTTQDLFKVKKWNVVQWPSHSPELNPTELQFTC